MSLTYKYPNLKENQDQKEQIICILSYVKKINIKKSKKKCNKINK